MNSSNFTNNPKSNNNISRTNSSVSNKLECESDSETYSVQSLSTYYNSKLTNIKLIYLIITFVNTLVGFLVFIEHKKIIYKEFKFLYFYIILSITYWPVSILIAGILIIFKSLKEKFKYSTNQEDKDNSLMIKFDTLSLTNYNSHNNYYSYLMGFFLFILLGFYVICIPTSIYILYNLFISQIFYIHIYKYYNIYLFIFLNLSKSIAIGISCLFISFHKYKSNKIKLDLDEEFVKKVEEEIEQVKKCSGIFIADVNMIKKNEMFNRQTFITRMQNGKNNDSVVVANEDLQNGLNKIKKNINFSSPNRKNTHYSKKTHNNLFNPGYVYNNSGSHIELIKKPDLNTFLYNNNSDQGNLNLTNFQQIDISPNKNKFIIPKNLDMSGNFNNFNHNYNFNSNKNLIINSQNDSNNKNENISKENKDLNYVSSNVRRPIRMSEKKTQIKDMIRTKTMITKKKESFINDLKKKLKLDFNEDIMRGYSNRNSLNENNVSPFVFNRVSKKFLEFRDLAQDEQNNESSENDINSRKDSKENRQDNPLGKVISPIFSKAKDDMDLIYHNKINSNRIVSEFRIENNKGQLKQKQKII